MLVPLSFHKFASPNSRVLVDVLINLDRVIATEERNNELPVVLIFVRRNHSSLKSHDVLIVCEYFGHIFFGRLWLEAEHTTQRILRSTVTIERRNLMLNRFSFDCLRLGEVQLDS